MKNQNTQTKKKTELHATQVILRYRKAWNDNACLGATTAKKIVLSSPKLSPSTGRVYNLRIVEMFLRGLR